MSAPLSSMMSWGAVDVAERFRHLAAVLVEREAVRQHHVEGRAPARAAAFRAARNGTSRDAGPSLRDTSPRRRRRRPCGGCRRGPGNAPGPPARRRGSSRNRTRRRGCRRPSARRQRRRPARGSARARPPRTRRRRPRPRRPRRCGRSRPRRCRISTSPRPVSRTKMAIGTPQARWRDTTQSGRLAIMPVMRFSPAAGTQRVARSRRARWRSVSPPVCDAMPGASLGQGRSAPSDAACPWR